MQHTKRQLLASLAMLPLLSSCTMAKSDHVRSLTPAQNKLQDMGLVLVVDAMEGAEMLGVEFFADGSDLPFYARSLQRRTGRAIMSFPSGTVPETVRVTWKDSSELIRKPDNPKKSTYGGKVLGDHTIPVASRIPDEVVWEIRRNGGGLRLKFRLHPDGVFFGWDTERFAGGLPRHSMAGGDFQEAGLAYELPGTLVYEAHSVAAKPFLDTGKYFVPPRSGDIWRKGWYIDKDGHQILTDH